MMSLDFALTEFLCKINEFSFNHLLSGQEEFSVFFVK